jgi:predicted DNA-binding transcriptional regulator AlpA
MTHRTSNPPRSPGAEPPLAPILKSTRELNCRERLLTARDAANLLRLSPSWLAKARMAGSGPPYIKLGRSIRYSETALLLWMRAHQRLSTSQQ